MPRGKKNAVPVLYHHKPSGQAKTRVNGVEVYLGVWGSKEADDAFKRLVAEYLATPAAPPARIRAKAAGVTVAELIAGYADHRSKDGTTGLGDNDKLTYRELRALYGRTKAATFGPLKLRALREKLVKADLCRSEVNRRVASVKRAFKWAASVELIPATTWQTLATLPNLKRNELGVRESPPVLPVSDLHVEATCRELSPMMAALIRFTRLTGCRIGETLSLTPRELDRSGEIWVYRKAKHKTAHHGKEKAIQVGPKAQAVLAPYLEGVKPDDLIFTPERAMQFLAEQKRSSRKTPVQPSQRGIRAGRKAKKYAPMYRRQGILTAIHRGCDRAGIPRWHPHQLRHTAATELRALFGPEHAKAVLGHSSLKITDRYAELDAAKAIEAAKKIV